MSSYMSFFDQDDSGQNIVSPMGSYDNIDHISEDLQQVSNMLAAESNLTMQHD